MEYPYGFIQGLTSVQWKLAVAVAVAQHYGTSATRGGDHDACFVDTQLIIATSR